MKKKLYMICDWKEGSVDMEARNIGVEFMGNCRGRILNEDGEELGRHWSSSYGWLRNDLMDKIEDINAYEVIDLIRQECPERFKLKE